MKSLDFYYKCLVFILFIFQNNFAFGQTYADFDVTNGASGSTAGTNVNSVRGTTSTAPTKGYKQYTWTVPSGVTSIRVEVWGAGGGGSGRPTSSYAGAGGGGGAYARKMSFIVTTDQILYIQVGRGGQGSDQGNTNPFPKGASGGTSYVKTGSHGGTVIASADGGDGATNGSNLSTGGGGISGAQLYTINGSSPTTNDIGYYGGNGGGGSGGTRGGGGGGGAGSAGAGGNGGSNTIATPLGGTAGIAQTVLYAGLAGSTGGSCGAVGSQGSTPTSRGGGGGGSGSGYNGTGGNGGDGFVRITYTISVAPVSLINFKANCVNKKVKLNWQTASELNNDYFEVEFSNDGNIYTSLLRVNGNGTTNEPHHYFAYDEQPLSGSNYYRLKQVDFNGTSTYYNPFVVNCNQTESISIYPNPNNGSFIVSGISEEEEIQLTDALGRTLLSKKGEMNYEVNNLQEGIYFVIIKSKFGLVQTQKIVVQR